MSELINIIDKDGTLLASSREIASNFGKRPSEVNRTIEGLINELGGVQNCTNLFFENKFQNDQNKQWYREFLLTRDGFTLVVMGFNGSKALDWKLKYIAAFNSMEAKLKNLPVVSREEQLVLAIYKGGVDAVNATKELTDLKVKEATTPLLETIADQAPKVDYHDSVLSRKGLLTTSDVAKDLSMTAIKLNRILHELKIIFKQSGNWKLYAQYQEMIPEYADYSITEYGQQLKWTEKGRKWIIDTLRHEGIIK